jgi:hypothetical protein
MTNSELIVKLTERLDDIVFDTFHFAELKSNSSSDMNVYNTFEFAKSLSRKIKKAIKRQSESVVLQKAAYT